MCDTLRVGDRIVWHADAMGRGVAPEAPGAQRREGVITLVHLHPDDNRVVAWTVERHSNLAGAYAVTLSVRDGHHPVRA
jgi:hypothetical protein